MPMTSLSTERSAFTLPVERAAFPAGERCAICDVPLTLLDAPTRPTCRAASCRWRYATLPEAQRCRVCGRPLSMAERVTRVCGRDACRQQRMREWQEWRELRRAEEASWRAAATAARAERAAALGIDAEAYPVVLTPAYTAGGLAPVSRARRRALRDHLRKVIAEAERQPATERSDESRVYPNEPVLGATTTAMFGAACATCRGYCCANGGERAYLSANTLRRYFAEHPGTTARQAASRYLRRVPAESQERSCIYHGAAGCTLPREMRSDTCNRYYCPSLTQLRRALDKGAPPRAFLAAIGDSALQRSAFVDEGADGTSPTAT